MLLFKVFDQNGKILEETVQLSAHIKQLSENVDGKEKKNNERKSLFEDSMSIWCDLIFQQRR